MSGFDEDMHAKLVSAPPSFLWTTQGDVLAAPITRGDEIVGYLFVGATDADADAAGVAAGRRGDFADAGAGYWSDQLRRLKQQGYPAADAVRQLSGSSGPDYAGRVGTDFERHSGRPALEALLNAKALPSRSEHDATRRAQDDAAPSPSDIDDVLRGSARSTTEISRRIAEIDAALMATPTPETLVVTLLSPLPDVRRLEPGVRVVEPTYLRATLLDTTTRTVPRVRLRVPEGTPALLLPGSESSTLLLGRGLAWTVVRVVDDGVSTLVTGIIESLNEGTR